MRKLVENNDPSRLTKIRMRGKVIYVEYGDKEIYLLIDTYLDTKEIGIFTIRQISCNSQLLISLVFLSIFLIYIFNFVIRVTMKLQ